MDCKECKFTYRNDIVMICVLDQLSDNVISNILLRKRYFHNLYWLALLSFFY